MLTPNYRKAKKGEVKCCECWSSSSDRSFTDRLLYRCGVHHDMITRGHASSMAAGKNMTCDNAAIDKSPYYFAPEPRPPVVSAISSFDEMRKLLPADPELARTHRALRAACEEQAEMYEGRCPTRITSECGKSEAASFDCKKDKAECWMKYYMDVAK